MKVIVGVVIVLSVLAGVVFGYNYAKQHTSTSPSSSSTSTNNKSSGTVLDLSNTGLTKVTSDIYNKTNTTELILSNNSIKTLPSEMGKMTNLVVFKIDHNILEGSLIAEVRKMSGLTTLDVSYNNMTGMPAEIGQLNKLRTLNYSHNNIDTLPNEIANLKNNLQELNLTGNPLSQEKINKLKTQLPNTTIIF